MARDALMKTEQDFEHRTSAEECGLEKLDLLERRHHTGWGKQWTGVGRIHSKALGMEWARHLQAAGRGYCGGLQGEESVIPHIRNGKLLTVWSFLCSWICPSRVVISGTAQQSQPCELLVSLSHTGHCLPWTITIPHPQPPPQPTHSLSTRRLNFPSPASSDSGHWNKYVQFGLYLLRNFPWVPEGCRTNTKCHSKASEAKSMPAQPPVNPISPLLLFKTPNHSHLLCLLISSGSTLSRFRTLV